MPACFCRCNLGLTLVAFLLLAAPSISSGLHRRRVRVQRQNKADFKVPAAPYTRRKPRVYHNDRHRPTDRSNIPSIVKAPLLSPGTYDAETLLRQRARSLSSASAEEEAAWVASGGQQARLSKLGKDGESLLTSTDSDGGSQADPDAQRDYFGRAPRVGVDGALGLADTDVDESGTESGRDSPVQRFSQFKGSASGHSRRRGLSGGLNFTPVSPDKPAAPALAQPLADTDTTPTHDTEAAHHHHTDSYSASVVSLSSNSPTSSLNGDRFLAPGSISNNNNTSTKSAGGSSNDDASSSNMSSSWIGVEATEETIALDPTAAALAAGVETNSHVWDHKSTS